MFRPTAVPRRRAGARLAAVAAIGVLALLAGCGSGEQAIDDPLPPEPTFGPNDTSGTTEGAADGFDHVGTRNFVTEAGPECDGIGQHSQMAMWNATLADDMVDLECPWPWDPALQELSGGEEDPAIDVEFAPRKYADLFEVIDAERFGVCEVRAVYQDEPTGLVFGFDVGLRAETCGEGPGANVRISINEYADRAFRDAAANAAGDDAMVMGRWVLTVTGEDTASATRLVTAVEAAGAVPLA